MGRVRVILPPEPPRPHETAGPLHRAESFCGLLIAGLFGLVAAGAGLLWIVGWPGRHSPAYWAGLGAAWLLLAAVELVFLGAMKRRYDAGEHPLPPRLALAQPRWPPPLRPVMFAWWLGHVAAVLVVAELLEQGLATGRRHLDGSLVPEEALRWFLRGVILFGGAYAANVYLLMAVTSVRRSVKVVELLWKRRVPIDLLTTGVLLALPPLWPK